MISYSTRVMIHPKKKRITFKDILERAADFYGLREKEILSSTRKKNIVKARQVIAYLAREELKLSFPVIGRRLGGRDHTTAIHSYEKVKKEIQNDNELKEEVKSILSIIEDDDYADLILRERKREQEQGEAKKQISKKKRTETVILKDVKDFPACSNNFSERQEDFQRISEIRLWRLR